MRKMLFITLLMGGLCTTVSVAKAQERLPEYLQAEKYTQEKLNTMLFSTVVDPHWFQKGNNFWFEYKTSEGTFWYVVDPAARTKKLLFDRDELASQLTEIVKDPFEARHLPITNLKAEEDGRTFTFEVKSTKDATPKKDGKDKKDKKNEKEIFYFSYDYPTRKLTHLKDKEDDLKKIYWGSVSPDGKTVIYAKDLNLYRMSREDYEKAKKNEKDSTIVEIQLTTDGMKDFGYGIPYSMLNTDTLCNGKRRRVGGDGLIVPNVKNCEEKSLAQIAQETEALIEATRTGKLGMEDMTGGTFTISSLGPYGITNFSPIINQPELAILGVCDMVDTPVVRDGQIVIRSMMNLCLTADHRVIDGVMASKFLKRIAELLENPYMLLV